MKQSGKTVWDSHLMQKYNCFGPRYTSYPTTRQFSDQLDVEQMQEELARLAISDEPLSLYLHIPFCSHLCHYCACHKIITKRHDKAAPYLARLYREIETKGSRFENRRMVEQMHWGGGTPTFLNQDEIHNLMTHLRAFFNLLDNDYGDYSIEVDPRECSKQKLHLLRYEGFNRISLGIQDLDQNVQKAVNRVQPLELIEDLVARARHIKFKSISMDLIYGLPQQTPESFATTIERILELSPDRLSLFNYNHLPEHFPAQRRIHGAELPSPAAKLEILENAICQLEQAGYQHIGMDLFVKPTDQLAIAQRQGQLYRNFQGYTAHQNYDLVAMGVSSISHIGRYLFQNTPNMDVYVKEIDCGRIPVVKGLKTSRDDAIRGAVIMQLICHFELHKQQISKAFKIEFDEYFANELAQLTELEQDGLLQLDNDSLTVTARGRLLVHAICQVFDAYLPQQKQVIDCYSHIA